jgi:hypothetical protein
METQPKMKWEIRTLEDAVRRVHGNPYADEIHDPLQSFAWKSDIAYFHACESERIIKEALASIDGIRNEDPDYVAVTKAILFAASPDRADTHILAAQFMAEAHIIASAQALHSLCDILSVIIYWSFQLDIVAKSLLVKKLNLHYINTALHKLPSYFTTANLIDATISSSEFAYLDAYVNTTKHKSLINSTLSSSFEADKRSGMHIKEFSYTDWHGTKYIYCCKWSHDFLFPENHSLRLKLISVGNSLNDHFK